MQIQIQAEGYSTETDWFHTTISQPLPKPSIRVGEYLLVQGRAEGRRGPAESDGPAFYGVDILGPRPRGGQRITLDVFDNAKEEKFKLEIPREVVSDPLGYFGIPRLMGQPFSLVFSGADTFVENGAHYEVHLRIRGVPICFDLRLRYYPRFGGYNELRGTLTITNSHDQFADVAVAVPTGVLDGGGHAFVAPGDFLATGQGPATFPVVYDRRSGMIALDQQKVIAKGIDRIGPLEKIAMPGAYDEAKWRGLVRGTFDMLTTWEAPPIGVAARSGDAGDQEDQGYSQGFESFMPNASLMTIRARLEAAYSMRKRPCHHLARDGSPLDPETQSPRLVYWNGQPHWHTGVSPNQLGKPRAPTDREAHNWSGPDNEHLLINNLAAAYELTGDMACHDELVHHAMLYLGSETEDPQISNTSLCIARALGWGCLAMTHCYRLLRSPALANRIRDRVQARIQRHMQEWPLGTLWDVRQNPGNYMGMDATVAPWFWMGYQQSVGAFGAYVACRVMGLPTSMKQWAIAAARDVVLRCYPSGREILGLAANKVTETADRNTGMFYRNWLALSLHVVLRELTPSDPAYPIALGVYNNIRSTMPNPLTEWSHFDDWVVPMGGEVSRG